MKSNKNCWSDGTKRRASVRITVINGKTYYEIYADILDKATGKFLGYADELFTNWRDIDQYKHKLDLFLSKKYDK